MKFFLPLLLFISTNQLLFAQEHVKLSGVIRDEAGEPLSHATVYVKEIGSGAVANDLGKYEILLKPGAYHLVFQYLGFTSVEKEVNIENQAKSLDVKLSPQVVMLKDIVVTGVDEDPAYAIMRKAIAKAKYHTQQIDSYSAKVYLKGKGRLIDAPFYLRNRLKKEGIDSSKTFVMESYNEIEYERPSTYTERVISSRSSGPEDPGNTMELISGSFYEPKIGSIISPLSPKAFAYYKFKYLGTFRDKDFEISKIRVMPRVEGDNVVKGTLYLVEDYFSIHSLNFTTHQMGIRIDLEQICEPIRENVWLPVSHQFEVNGEIWGFDFEFNYLASVSEYDITLNPDLPHELEIIDEKTEKNLMEEYESISETKDALAIQEKLTEGEEVATKDLQKVLRTYEKQEKQEKGDPFVAYKKKFIVDSTAFEKDSAYWAQLRPIPLNKEEIEGYNWLDSLAEVQRKKEEGDSIRSDDKENFSPFDVVMGGRYDVGDKAFLSLKRLAVQYNTVEGLNLETNLQYTKTFENKEWLKINPIARYGFSSEDFYYRLNTEYAWGPKLKRSSFKLNGGKYIFQYNPGNPISPTVNTLTTLFWQDNLMKLYEKNFVDLGLSTKIREDLTLDLGGEWSKRYALQNTSDYTLIDVSDKTYSSNIPDNAEMSDTDFESHQSTIINIGLTYRPGLRYMQFNDNFFETGDKTPEIKLNYRQGVSWLDGESDFRHLHLNAKKTFDLRRNNLNVGIGAGTYFNDAPEYFIDFRHFDGNESPFLPSGSFETFRLLDYYRYSTGQEYVNGHLQYNPTKLLLTQFKKLRFEGIKEYLFMNYLHTPVSDNYFELGIAFDNIFRIFKVEAISSFQGGSYQDFGVRVGLASFINFDNNSIQLSF